MVAGCRRHQRERAACGENRCLSGARTKHDLGSDGFEPIPDGNPAKARRMCATTRKTATQESVKAPVRSSGMTGSYGGAWLLRQLFAEQPSLLRAPSSIRAPPGCNRPANAWVRATLLWRPV